MGLDEPALAVLMLLETVQFWWLSQSWYASATELRLIEFLPRLVILLLIYLLAAAVLPDEVPEQGIDLRAFYVGTSRYFWALILLLTLSIMVFLAPTDTHSYLGGIARHLVLDGIVVAVALAALAFRSIRVQQAAVVVLCALVVWAYLASASGFR